MSQSKNIYPEFSGAVQQKSTVYIRKPNEVATVKNVDFATKLGAMRRRLGAQGAAASLPALPVVTPPLGAYIARFPGARELWAVQNNNANTPTSSILQRWTGLAWSNIQTGMQPSVEANITDDLDEVWCSFYDPATDLIYPPFTVDAAHTVSTTRQLNFAPQGRYYMEFAGAMWTFDVLANGTRYRNRAYKSSGPTGVISFARSAQTDVPITFNLVNQIPIMTSNSAPVGAAAASNEASASFAAWKAFDGINTGTDEWSTSGTSGIGWLRYDFGSGVTKVITHYSMMGIAIGETGTLLPPKTWTFEGTNDATFATWTVIDTQTNAANFTAGETRTYTTSNTTAYRWYRVNVSAGQGTGNLVIADLQFLNSSSNVNLLQLAVDSARYLKPGQLIDCYAAGTDTKLYDITIIGVDKANDIITFLPYSQIFGTGGVSTATDVITVGDASKMTTGTPIKFTTTGGLPAGLSAGVAYYAITGSSTTFKVATTTLNATLGVAVDITTTGSGNHTVQLSYIIGNKDELWAHGRKGMLTRFWNTDYRNPEASDWIKIPPTQDALDQITAVGKLSGRMFMFTPHSMTKYDGQQTLQLRDDIGCIAHKSISYYDSYMVWLDASGNIWARNEEAGTMDVISEAISDTLALVPLSQLPQATSVCIDGVYKLYLGVIGTKSLRVVYNFKTNQWSIEWFTPRMPLQFEYTYSGLVHPHFFDEKGQLWVDEQGNDDDGAVIPFEAELGDDNFGYEELKAYYGIKVYAKAVAACKVMVSLDGGQFIDQGQLTKPIQAIRFKNMVNATTINVKFVDSSSKAPVEVDRATVYYDLEEDTFVPTK
jgi:hypothetical protein